VRRATPLILGALSALVTAGVLHAPVDALTGATIAQITPRPATTPESATEKGMLAADLSARHVGPFPLKEGAYAAGVAQAERLAAAAAKAAPRGTWKRVGKGALHNDTAGYDEVNGLGLRDVSGRIQKFAYDPSNPKRWFAGVASGGVWESLDQGTSWHSISDGLPTQNVGAVEFLPGATKGSGTLLVGTGDPAVGAPAIPGLGAFWSDDSGATWTRAAGIPNSATTYRIAFDKQSTDVNRPIYQATNRGLWRSTDRGRSYTNVVLPTGCTDLARPRCFFANFVTDVTVRASNADGTGGGKVMAGIGWRYGQRKGVDGQPMQPKPGLYASDTGLPGSFTHVNPTGFPGDDIVGRIALGSAYGPKQNHDYLYAAVADASRGQNINGPQDVPIPALPDPSGDLATVKAIANSTVFKGVYGSSDFGKTWTLLADADQLKNPGTHSALNGYFSATGYSPGIQAWYNLWVQPDPFRYDAAGAPTFLAFGLEEVWGGQGAILAPNTNVFQVFGRYFAGDACFGGLSVANPTGYCPTTVDPLSPAPSGDTVHPDQHAVMFVPDSPTGDSGETLVVGNDGGVYSQHSKEGAARDSGTIPARFSDLFDNQSWKQGLNTDLYTLLPYDADMAADGITYAGLQDNGSMRIEKDGRQIGVYGGDGFYVAVDPANSNIAWEEYTFADTRFTTNGGKTWTSSSPSTAGSTTTQFSNPFTMDPLDSKHLLSGGRQVSVKTNGPVASGWVTVFDLGDAAKPGDPNATGTDSRGFNNNNLPTAVDLRGANAYLAYCSLCDPIKTISGFSSGLATNVGGSKPPAKGSPNGWHIAAAKGLPDRLINGVTIDPNDPKTVYASVGTYVRQWVQPGAFGEDTSKLGTGHVYVSHDAGETFTDITGNLPLVPANATVLHDGDLVVGTDVGAYVLPDVAKSEAKPTWESINDGLARTAVFSLQISPRNTDEIVAATYGRGVQSIVLTPGTSPTKASSGTPRKPTAKPTAVGSLAATGSSLALPALAGLLVTGSLVLARRRRETRLSSGLRLR
jgi:hypothetical protein